MQYRPLCPNGPDVSLICLGTMTWGQQNTEAQAWEQLDYALEQGVNFIDTAEVYSVPIQKETYTLTEQYIGRWLKERGCRDKIILATKVAGPALPGTPAGGGINWIRGGGHRLNRQHIEAAVDASLKRLNTDYIDLYQLHWPERSVPIFGQRLFEKHPQEPSFDLEETLSVMNDLVKAGKIRYIGLSNESPWGMMRYQFLAESKGYERPITTQNCYNLLNRAYEVSTSEVSLRENMGLLVYSPLASGLLSGKYQNGQRPEGSRLTLFGAYFSRYLNERAENAVKDYETLAQENGLTLTQLALAFVNSRPFVTANIIGATTLDQLQENISSWSVTLSDDALKAIEAIHTKNPDPCP
jgi:aryl-alcohol dehydrogenase-like predicted oxidoreductase